MSQHVSENEAEADKHEAARGSKGASWSQRAVKEEKHYCSFVSNRVLSLLLLRVPIWTDTVTRPEFVLSPTRTRHCSFIDLNEDILCLSSS